MTQETLTIELTMGVLVNFIDDKKDHNIKIETIDRRTGMDDHVFLSHQQKLKLIKWLVNSINT